MDTIRTFIAVEIPVEVRALLADKQDELQHAMGAARRAVRWSRSDGMHLTLQFLGDVPLNAPTTILEAVRAGCRGISAITLGVGNVGAFPTLERPRVLWLGLEGDTDRLQTLQAKIARLLSGLGYKPDKPFQPHITLGRIREGATRDELATISNALVSASKRPPVHATFTAHQVSLMKSDLLPGGAVYTCLGVEELDG